MEYLDDFIEFANGNLNDSQESELFARLASNQEFRSEFRAFNSIGSSINQDLANWSPRPEIKSSIFAKAGLAMPIDTPMVSTSKTALYATKFKSTLLPILFSTALTAVIMLLLFKPDGQGDLHDNSAITESTIINNNLDGDAEMQTKSEILSNPEYAQKETIKYVYVYLNENGNETISEKIEDNLQNKSEIYSSNLSVEKDFNLASQNQAAMRLQSTPYPNHEFEINLADEIISRNWSFNLEQSIPWHLPQETINPASFNKFNNLAIKVFYKLSDVIKFGVAIDQSTFFTIYEGTDDIGSVYRYTQQPNLTTFSALGHLTPYESDLFKTYIQLGLGANISGFVFKPAVGLEFKAYPNLSIVFSAGLDYFRFVQQDKWFDTRKLLFNYGISYKL
ncbi:MAG: hypothetical protein CVV22_08275 [Ignavibacteriae bacterium HGW-Ignavibacteriae-1]|jgi:hypothetical protein|nr:MAG: hypothetical protein CVV22_08275 [Ignavibacteriae bacterium HGW-Ignavibacteriae-1]